MFIPTPNSTPVEIGSDWKRYFVKPILWLLVGEETVSVRRRSQDKQRAVCTASPISPPSSYPLCLLFSLDASKKIQLPRKGKRGKHKRKVRLAPEITLLHLFCWCYLQSTELEIYMGTCRRFGRCRYIVGKRCYTRQMHRYDSAKANSFTYSALIQSWMLRINIWSH